MPPVFASQIRVLPYSVHRRTVCLRIELIGCISSGKFNIFIYNKLRNYLEIVVIST
ncbi:hypothetical protein O3M35_002619 [Rhynocoris fuscipes]|uniref:F5/8 type C domain-containing protein n=1 Tax=Rhynocoris fuscipes TaxID=488301 RepID=A0AAW1CPZ3_9HEMI